MKPRLDQIEKRLPSDWMATMAVNAKEETGLMQRLAFGACPFASGCVCELWLKVIDKRKLVLTRLITDVYEWWFRRRGRNNLGLTANGGGSLVRSRFPCFCETVVRVGRNGWWPSKEGETIKPNVTCQRSGLSTTPMNRENTIRGNRDVSKNSRVSCLD